MAHLVIENLSKSFGDVSVLADLNLKVQSGSLMVLLGPSGCGKSTVLRLIAGLEHPDRGKIILGDIDITALEPQQRKTAMVFQNYALYPHMTVFENIAFPLRVARLGKEEIKAAVHSTAQLLELESLLDRRPSQLSGGQRQRVALGRGLIRKPSIFLLDEPLSNLDAALRVKMRREIVALQKKMGITMIYVTHDQTEALTMADEMIVMKEGAVHQHGSPDQIYKDPSDQFVASFIGTPPINLFQDEIKDGQLQKTGSRVNHNDYPAITVGIRPEQIKISPDGALAGTIIETEYIGSSTYLKVATPGLELTIIENGSEDLAQIGDKVNLEINAEQVMIFETDQKDGKFGNIKSGRRIRPDQVIG